MSIEITEKSLDLALIKASGQLGVTSNNLAFEVIKEEKKLWGLLGTTITVKAWIKNPGEDELEKPKKAHKKRSYEEKKATKEISKVLSEGLANDIQSFTEKLCTLILQGAATSVKIKQDGKTCILTCDDDFIAEKISKNPKIAESIEQIILRAFKNKISGKSIRIFFEAKDVRKSKKQELKALARKLSNKASKSKKTIALNYRHAYDRKIIHTTLDSDDRVYTKSVGSGQSRKLLIIPVKDHDRRLSQ